MGYQKIIKLLDAARNQPSKFSTRNWVEINDESKGMHNISNQIKFETSMIRSNLCHYSDTYIHVEGSIQSQTLELAATPNNRNKKVILQNCAPFTNCISKINNTQVDDAHDIDVVTPMYSLIENIDFYSKASESSWKYYRHEPALDNDNDIIGFPADGNNGIFFKTANSRANKKQWHKRC